MKKFNFSCEVKYPGSGCVLLLTFIKNIVGLDRNPEVLLMGIKYLFSIEKKTMLIDTPECVNK